MTLTRRAPKDASWLIFSWPILTKLTRVFFPKLVPLPLLWSDDGEVEEMIQRQDVLSVFLFNQGEPITFDDDVFVASRPPSLQPFLQEMLHLQVSILCNFFPLCH